MGKKARKFRCTPYPLCRYEQYNAKHGAKILAEEEAGAGEEEDDW